ncbi:hypothetical protein AA106555_1604 [Neokomagataea thailandica NBRC 106555]|uniref:Uncharacterized protein n=1 Tax=Neokomagataea thailandica NBRC 106555 TaxID=1223520 RepID=A0ABQ0QRH7_9PROT|nr:hypothetical protein AA106555_1604 [Neokomagataea thailandica NBRC 106555]
MQWALSVFKVRCYGQVLSIAVVKYQFGEFDGIEACAMIWGDDKAPQVYRISLSINLCRLYGWLS